MLAHVPREKWPRHIAIIMDGNGRWARMKHMHRSLGHRQGARVVRQIVEEASDLKLKQITLYAFSSENWKRPRREVNFIMQLLRRQLVRQRSLIMENNIRFRCIGRREELPSNVLAEMERTETASASNTGTVLALAVNYGGRQEIVDAARRFSADVADGKASPEDISEERFAGYLYTAGMPDPDLLIRTANEMRVSNFMLWQISYAELHVTPVLWPDFTEKDLWLAISDYASRRRRFGALGEA